LIATKGIDTVVAQDNQLWLAMWENQQTDFHQPLVNRHLQEYWHRLKVPNMGRVLVPLCGKSNDLLWLAARGFEVIGIELSSLAVKAFFKENQLKPKKTRSGHFTIWRHGRIRILCGDIFLLKNNHLGQIDAVYDRAALTALAEPARKQYVRKLLSLMPLLKPILLLTTEDVDPLRTQDSAALVDQEIFDLFSPHFAIAVSYGDAYPVAFSPATVNKVYQMKRLTAATD